MASAARQGAGVSGLDKVLAIVAAFLGVLALAGAVRLMMMFPS